MNIAELLYKVKDIMSRDFIKVNNNISVKAVAEVMRSKDRDEVVIVDEDDKLLGIFTRRDLAKIDMVKHGSDPMEKFMITNIMTTGPLKSAREARDIMITHGIGRIPVIEDEKVIGVFSANNLRDTFYLKIDEMFDLQSNILDNIHEAICICDRSGVIIHWNKSAEKLYSLKAEEVVGTYVEDKFNNPIILKALKEGKAIENIKHEPIKGKSVILSAIPIYDSENELVAVVSTDRDITEVVSLSKQLESVKEKVELLSTAYNREIANNYSFSSIIGKSKKIIDSIALCQKVSSTTASVLITGESGTGKEVFAKSVHEASGRKGQFVAVNCSAIPEHLLESELFGYVEGAFTGAVKKGKIGMFEFANNGTLFLDEIGDMPIGMQSKLLRVLQDGVVYRLGSEKPIHTNTRIVAATNKNLRESIKNKTFRDDLFYRLAVVQVELPPLRERKEDIKDLVNTFVSQVSRTEGIEIKGIDPCIYGILNNYKWEGNIRELKNVVQRIVVLSNGGHISTNSIPEYILNESDFYGECSVKESTEDRYDLEERVKNLEYDLIKEVMEFTGGNKAKAADILKIKRTTLYYKLKQYGLIDTCQ